MTRRRTDDDEIVTSRASDLEILRVLREAQRSGQKRRVAALSDLGRAAQFRQHDALGVTIRRRDDSPLTR